MNVADPSPGNTNLITNPATSGVFIGPVRWVNADQVTPLLHGLDGIND